MLRKWHPPGVAALGIVGILFAPLLLEMGFPDLVLWCALVGFVLIILGVVLEWTRQGGRE